MKEKHPRTSRKWNSVYSSRPKVYQLVEAKGKWICEKMLYLDDEQDGWEQKQRGQIEVTDWRPK